MRLVPTLCPGFVGSFSEVGPAASCSGVWAGSGPLTGSGAAVASGTFSCPGAAPVSGVGGAPPGFGCPGRDSGSSVTGAPPDLGTIWRDTTQRGRAPAVGDVAIGCI